MLSEKILPRRINCNCTILDALKLMDERRVKLLLVFDNEQFTGIVTIGDLQRAIIGNTALNDQISNILEPNKIYADESTSIDDIKSKMLYLRAECMPVVNNHGELVDVFFWEDLFPLTEQVNTKKINLPVVVMAGGKGERLKPITNVIPKPLIPIGDKTIIESILDKFEAIGCFTFYLTVNYKADVIKYYFENIEEKIYNIKYVKESKPLGTIGSLTLLKNEILSTFFVSNCDILIEQDYRDVYDYHVAEGNEITVVAALKNYNIPYGIIESGAHGKLTKMDEKPNLTFMINSGVYILEPHLIDEIPDDTFFHITQLIEKVMERNGKVGVFPVSEGAWKDIGQWDLFLQYNKIKINQ